jgi:hypothetical protein
MEDQFYEVMNAHSDEELLNVYKNQHEYTFEAIEAMEAVLRERNLLTEATEVLVEKMDADFQSNEAIYDAFQRAEFGKVISDVDFARENLSDSIYFQRFISPLHNYNWLNHLFIIFGIVGATLAFIVIGIGEYQSPFNIILICSGLAALLLPLGILKLRKNKAQLSIRKEAHSTVLQIKGSKDDLTIQFPLRFQYYWDWHTIRYGLKQVKLSIFIFDDQNDCRIEFRELLEIQKSPPPHWERISPDLISEHAYSSTFAYLNHGTQVPFLYQLQKILSGLHREEE